MSDDHFAVPTPLCRLIIEQDTYGRVVVDGVGTVLQANRAAAELLGCTVDQLVGTSMLDHVVAEDLGVAAAGAQELQDRGPRETEGIAMVFGLDRPDGTVAHVEVGAENFLDVEGVGVVSLRMRPYDSQYHLQRFLRSMVEGGGHAADFTQLVGSLDHMLQSAVCALSSEWDGHRFATVATRSLPPHLCGAGAPHEHSAGAPHEHSAGAPHEHGAGAPHEYGAGAPESGVETELPWAVAVGTGEIAWAAVEDLPESLRQTAADLGLAALWAVPVPIAPGADSHDSVIVVWRRVPGGPKLGHREGLLRSADVAALAFERSRQQRELLRAATIDPLTGLPNRSEFFAALGDVENPPTAVLYVDLDGFKAVNDVLGHRFGDRVLQAVAGALAAVLEPGSLLARLGGDEFAVLAQHETGVDVLTEWAERLVAAVARPFSIEGQSIRIGLSVGIAMQPALIDGQARIDGEALLDAADRALYEIKRNGKGGWAFAHS